MFLTAGTTRDEQAHERFWPWSHLDNTLPEAEKLSCPTTLSDSQKPELPPAFESHGLLTVKSDLPLQLGQPLYLECRLSPAVKSELNRPTALPVDKRYKRNAYVVALDATLLQAQGRGKGINPFQAARQKHLARKCYCAPKALISEDVCQLSMQLSPQYSPAGEALVLLQVVVEASIDKTYWVPFSRLEPVQVIMAGSEALDAPSAAGIPDLSST